jgi:hypothetical protein
MVMTRVAERVIEIEHGIEVVKAVEGEGTKHSPSIAELEQLILPPESTRVHDADIDQHIIQEWKGANVKRKKRVCFLTKPHGPNGGSVLRTEWIAV